jgi:hypothetical protein
MSFTMTPIVSMASESVKGWECRRDSCRRTGWIDGRNGAGAVGRWSDFRWPNFR